MTNLIQPIGSDTRAPQNKKPHDPGGRNLNGMRLVWKVPTLNRSLASFRYRCLIPLKHLADRGVVSEVYSDSDPVVIPNDTDALIFVKSFSKKDLRFAKKAHARSIPVVLDLCDNIFFPIATNDNNDLFRELQARETNFLKMAEYARLIVTPTADLARIVSAHLPKVPVMVVPDAFETDEDSTFADRFRYEERMRQWKSRSYFLLARAYFPRLYNFVTGSVIYTIRYILQWMTKGRKKPHLLPKSKREQLPLPQVLWFGNAGINNIFGISDLILIQEALTEVYRQVPFQLTVVSSSTEAFAEHVSPLPFATRYVSWSQENLARELKKSAVVVIPNPMNDFSRCKSANRALLALGHGVPVVATKTNALEPLSSCLIFDDWKNGVKTYLLDPERSAKDVNAGREIIAKEFTGTRIAHQWAQLLERL